ncbi:MAG: cadherin-like domain-containing protein, partial [Pirellulaceae bacterium]|nr:cadherin-like domain-containing protein [Pirellulaceae bacterium]
NTSLIAPNQTQVMEQDPLAVQNSWQPGVARDLGTTNLLDPGMRMVLPGTAGTTNTYYLRVRSNNRGPSDPQSKLQDGNALREGKTAGAYRLQVRLQQTDEVAGSSLHYADVRFATNGLEALATPVHSPLVGDNATTTPGTQLAALNLGDIGRSDRGALTAAGQLNSGTEVVWYEFSVRRNDVQIIPPAGAALPTSPTHVSMVFDIDYADGFGGPNTNLWVYNKADGRLVYMGTDSNILDDRAAPTEGSDVDDLTRGSAGSRDPFIGTQALPVGDYFVAVSSNRVHSVAMGQFQSATGIANGANSTLTRLEPIESVRRVAEDRFEITQRVNPSTAQAPLQVAFSSTAGALNTNNQVPFTLGDMVAYSIRNNGNNSLLQNLNVMTGATEANVSTTVNAGTNYQLRDIAMRIDGGLMGYHIPINTGANSVTDATSGIYVQTNIAGTTGATTSPGASGITTFTTEATGATTFAIQQRNQTAGANTPVGDGIQFNGLTFWSDLNRTNASLIGVAVGSRGNGITSFNRAVFDANNAVIGVSPVVNFNATNVVYAINPATGAAQNATGTNTRTGNAVVNGAGTNIVEMGRFLSGTLANRFTDGTVTGLAKIGNNLYAVSNLGELFEANVGPGNNQFAANFTVNTATELYSGRLPINTLLDNGVPITFAGLSAGPANLVDGNGVSLANVLFGITNTGVIYAFDTAGNPRNIFPGGVNKVQSASGVGASFGLAFSPLDVNLWHITNTRETDPGHNSPLTFNNSRPLPENDRRSLYFGFEQAGTTNLQQNGIWTNRHSVFNNTVDLPGGAKGAIESLPIDLSGYSADDLPMLYFNYYLQTENANAFNPNDTAFMKDAFRVYGTVDGSAWTLLATNNSQNNSRTLPNTFVDNFDEYDQGISNYVDAFGNRTITQELFDVNDGGAPNNWRQARINLSPFAGNQDLRLRFEFSTGGTFNTGNPLIGGVELSVVPAVELTDGHTVTVTTTDQQVAQAATFEFDLGLVLNMPGGASIPAGSTLNLNGTVFLLDTVAGPGVLVYSPTATPAQVAQGMLTQLQALGFAGYIHATRSNVLVLPTGGLTPPGTYAVTGLVESQVIEGRPGTTGVPVPVLANTANYAAGATAVRNALRTAMANQLANGQTGTFSVYGQTIRMFKYNVSTTAPLGIASTRYGDRFGVNNNGTGIGAGVAERGQNNAVNGVFVDDIIIGFAERGEQVFNAPLGNNTQFGANFFPNRDYEPNGFNSGGNFEENEEGRFQLEIRTANDYGISYPRSVGAVPPPSDFFLLNTCDTNNRATSSLALRTPAAGAIADGTTFTLSDGTNLATFEFDVVNGNVDIARGTAAGNIAISITSRMTAGEVARAVRSAINLQALVNVTASVQGEMVSGVADLGPATDDLVFLNGKASIGRTGQGLPAGSPLTLVTFGRDIAGQEDLGDTNRSREEQGQLIVSSTSFSFASQWGVRLDDTPSPVSPRNLPSFNVNRLAVGAVLVNNIFNSNVAGGVTIVGDLSTTLRPVVNASVGRLINNTFHGTRASDSGVSVTGGASPTIMNNIFSNFNTAIAADAASTAGTVVGANVFKTNNNNGLSGSFPITLAAADPLFVNPTAANFYLAASSQAIDSSLEALAERLSLSTMRSALGLPPSPMLAPDRDIFGQRRVDDPTISTPAGLGSNVFKDRGATDRADFAALQAVLLQPQDNDSANVDVDRTISYVRVSSGLLDYFSILLQDGEGIGPNSATVTPSAIRLTENGRLLVPGVDYTFGYNINSRTVRMTPLSGIWRSDSVYEITMNNRDGRALQVGSGAAITAGDTVTVTLPDSTTRVLTFRKTPSVAPLDVVVSNQDSPYQVSLKVVEKINQLGGGVSAYLQGSGLIMVVGSNALASSRATSAVVTNINAIRDLAGNALAANRANTLTQFTIVMPDVRVDYGDTSATPTLQSVNGARHALLPVDAPLLALGQFADADGDGAPTASATGDDNDTFVDLLTLGSLGGVVQGPSGPATLLMPAGATPGLDGQRLVITDPLLKSITVEFNTDAAFTAGNVVVDVLLSDTAAQVATKFATAVNNAVLAGRVAGIAAVASSSSVSLGGTGQHQFNLIAAPAVTRLPVGNVELLMPATVSTALDGLAFRVMDGAGNVVTFEINDTSLAPAPALVTAGFVGVDVNLATATPALLANAIATAINAQRGLGTVALGVASVIGNSVIIRANDEDGVSFGSIFNARANAVPVTVVSTGSGVVDAWIDWNGDGDYIDAGEQVLTGRMVQAGANVFNVTTPTTARIGFTTSRFRLSVMGGLLPDQLAVGGEVEDHLLEIVDGTPPVAVNDAYTMAEDGVLTVAIPGVLANDTDVDNVLGALRVFDPNPATPNVEPVVSPVNGQLSLNTDGSFTYTPNLDFFGTDSFVYLVTDPRLLSNTPATVTITVTPVNDAPLGINDTITILEDAVTTLPGSTFWGNDQRHFRNDPNENGQILTLINAVNISPAGGVVSVTNDTLSYTPPAHYNNAINGPAIVVLTIRDSGVAGGDDNPLTTTSTLTINITSVNDRPEFTMPAVHATTEDAGLVTQPGFITGIRPGPVVATDEGTGPALVPENQTISFNVTAQIPALFKTLPLIDAAGQLTYELQPDVNRILLDIPGNVPGFSPILVEVIAQDTGSDVAPNLRVSLPVTFTIQPTEVNDVPEFDIKPEVTSLEDVGLVTDTKFMPVRRPGPTTALDEVNQELEVVISADPAAFTQLPSVDLTTGTLTYITAPHINSFTGQSLVVGVTVREKLVPTSATTKSFTINVTPVNDAPEFTIKATSTPMEDAGIVTEAGFITGIRPGPVIAIDEGVARENQTVSFNVTAQIPALFKTLPLIDAAGQLTYELQPDVNRILLDIPGNVPGFSPILVQVIAQDTG